MNLISQLVALTLQVEGTAVMGSRKMIKDIMGDRCSTLK